MGVNTYSAVGNREDLSDIITNISPKATPFMSKIGTVSADATNHEWLEDSLSSPKENAVIEGSTFSVDDAAPRVRLGNYTQMMRRGYKVTDTQEKVMKAGIKSEIAHNMAKALKEYATDEEYAFLFNAAKVLGNATDTARKLGGIPAYVTTNVFDNLPGTGGTPRVLDQATIDDALQACWDEGGDPTLMFMSGGQKRLAAAWTAGGDRYIEAGAKKLINAIEIYESSFGVISLIPHRQMPDTDVYLIQPDLWKKAYLRKPKTIDLPKTGSFTAKVIEGEVTLEARAEKGNAIITDLTLTTD